MSCRLCVRPRRAGSLREMRSLAWAAGAVWNAVVLVAAAQAAALVVAAAQAAVVLVAAALVLGAWLPVVYAEAAEPGAEVQPFALQDGERVVFFGDSITQQGQYVTYVHAYLLTRFPEMSIEIINHGISSETLSGTSEPDHNPPRPHALARFARDVAAWRPDVVVACFGMNDGNYHPIDEERFAKYREGVHRLCMLIEQETQARLVLLTPPPFDPYRRTASDPQARTFGYKFPAIDYDDVLAAYSRWLMQLGKEPGGPQVVDVHSAIHRVLAERRKTQVSFTVSPDAVHPNATGHWLMAQELLRSWHAPALAGELWFDARRATVCAGDGQLRQQGSETFELEWRSSLPLPQDEEWDEAALQIAGTEGLLNRYVLRVTGLSEGDYQLSADGREVAVYKSAELAAGVQLGRQRGFPTVETARQVLLRLRALHTERYAAWRKSLLEADAADASRHAATDEEEFEAIRTLCRPRPVLLRLERLE